MDNINHNSLRSGMSRHEMLRKQIFDDIQKNIKDNESFISQVNKIKKSFNELIYYYFNSDKESK
jgi:hypothetical protein